jgi:hypothetical protein
MTAMHKTENRTEIGTQQEMTKEELARRKAAKRALLERVAKQPAMNIGKWTRDELYDC